MLKFLLTHGQGKKTTKSDLHFPSKLYCFFADLNRAVTSFLFIIRIALRLCRSTTTPDTNNYNQERRQVIYFIKEQMYHMNDDIYMI